MNLFVPELSWTGENFANVQLTTRFMTSSSLLHLKASSEQYFHSLAGLSTKHKGSIHLRWSKLLYSLHTWLTFPDAPPNCCMYVTL